MTSKPPGLLSNPLLNNWKLFWLITAPLSLLMFAAMLGRDMSGAAGVSSMIQFSIRCAVPLLYLVFAISSVHRLMPGELSRWLLRNRKLFGLCLAAAMAWQGFFILWMLAAHTDYYVNEVYVLSDAIEGVAGYLLLLAMVITSFKFGRKLLTGGQWRFLHKFGIYYLWAYAWSVYWFNLYYYSTPNPLDYLFYWAGFLAWGLRLLAWARQRAQRPSIRSVHAGTA